MPLLSTLDAATRIGVSPRRLRQLAQTGRIKSSMVAGRLAFDVKDVEAFRTLERPSGKYEHKPRKTAATRS